MFISDYLSERCSCLFSPSYLADGEILCNSGDSKCVLFQGRLISSQDADSVELLLYLKEWSLTMPKIEVGAVELQITGNDSVIYPPTGSIIECEPIKTEHLRSDYRKAFIGTTVILVFLALAVVVFAVIAVKSCLKLPAVQTRFTAVQTR